jgi:hypothetical protein
MSVKMSVEVVNIKDEVTTVVERRGFYVESGPSLR